MKKTTQQRKKLLLTELYEFECSISIQLFKYITVFFNKQKRNVF